MPDREKVISTLEEIKTQTAGIGLDSAVIAHEFIDKIIDLLKEQEAVVRCKDCKHNARCEIAFGCNGNREWYCADGERRADDA